MAAFDRVASGIESMDNLLDSIRMGDNVVWQVSDLEDFAFYAKRYVAQAIRDGRNMIYVRFASHAPLVEPQEGLRIVEIELSHRFENFTVEIHNLIEQEGRDAFYLFDCLSELQTAWATDLLMGDFFYLTCPFLFQLDTVAWFPLIRGKHSFEAVNIIKDTTQLFLDLHSYGGEQYLRPVKVWRRDGETMFQPHLWEVQEQCFRAVTDAVEMSHFYKLVNSETAENQNIDSWDRFFLMTELRSGAGMDVEEECSRICNIMLTRDERLRRMIKALFRVNDYMEIRKRMIGTGIIGGKACGMLLARKIVEARLPEMAPVLEEHDSYYIGADVFYTYIVFNGFWDLRIRQRREEEYFSAAKELEQKLQEGLFPQNIREQFRRMLEYYGREPIIVRSSSILEDGFGNAFAGKYESVFCANAGSFEENLEAFEDAVRRVYASTMNRSALQYRLQRGLEKRDEQMAILVQRVSGFHCGNYLLPAAAGIAYSYSPYRMSKEIDVTQGMLRLVMGLGTAAVDRKTGTYPRIVQLSKPEATPYFDSAEQHRFSQRIIDVIDMKANGWESVQADQVLSQIPLWMRRILLSHDREAESSLQERGIDRTVEFVSCGGIVANDAIMNAFRRILASLRAEYEHPVDVEFTINFSEKGAYAVNLLQCRPLVVAVDKKQVQIPTDYDEKDVLLDNVHASMGISKEYAPQVIVAISSGNYCMLKQEQQYQVARILGQINQTIGERKETSLLFTPGRICTTSPDLGVTASFAEICGFGAICEVTDAGAGFLPELSYGSHIFQDLVEAEILYTAVFANDTNKAFHPEYLDRCENLLGEYAAGAEDYTDTIKVIRTDQCILRYDMLHEHLLVTLEN